MDDTDIVDEVNKLIKLGVGDAYRLEHIKQAYIQNKTLWVTDENYLKRLREKYITNHQAKVQESIDENSHENKETIHCWKCGKKTPLGANFCMVCGSSLFEVGAEHKPERNEISVNPKNQKSSMDLKIPIIVGIPILILIILGGAYSQGYFDNTFEKDTSDKKINSDIVTESKELEGSTNLSDNGNSKCGPG
ncbi:MAG: zinc ribbon domain-containing protein, partial [Nitrosopumilus sp.]